MFSSMIFKKSEESRERTKRILLTSDGDHNEGPDPEPISEALQRQGVVIDAIGIGSRSSADFKEDRLKRIASPGRYCFIDEMEELVKKFESLAGHLRVRDGE